MTLENPVLSEGTALSTDDYFLYFASYSLTLNNQLIEIYYESLENYLDDSYTEVLEIYVDGVLTRTLNNESTWDLYFYEYNNFVYLYNMFDNMLYNLTTNAAHYAYLEDDKIIKLDSNFNEIIVESPTSYDWIYIWDL